MERRDFVKSFSALGLSAFAGPLVHGRPFAGPANFSLHPFIQAHPEAVFIKRTNVTVKTDAAAKLLAGRNLASEIFVLGDSPGIPLTRKIAIKPNLTLTYGTGATADGMGILTDRDFMEGMLSGMIEQGFPASNMYLREGNMLGDGYCKDDYALTGYPEMAQRIGVNLTDFPTRKIYAATSDTLAAGTEVTWKDCPNGVVFKRIGYIAPVNGPDSWLLNVAKLKTHGMGMTLCVKNLQGTCIYPYIRFCNTLTEIAAYPAADRVDFQSDLRARIAALYAQHLQAGVPRWDRPGEDFTGGMGMELWAQRTCDSHSVMSPGLHIIEGIYGRNGNGFIQGPGAGGVPEDFMANLLIFGTNPFLVDVIGTWLAGHEPGNFGLFHIAQERGLTTTFNPADIPVYSWESGQPALASLSTYERTPLVTTYLRKDYNGGTEPQYHLVNEPYAYASARPGTRRDQPRLSVVGNVRQSGNGSWALLQYQLSAPGQVRLAVYNAGGECVDVLVDQAAVPGAHLATWRCGRRAAGRYLAVLDSRGCRAVQMVQVW